MSSVNVDYEDLIRFKATLEQNASHFDEIRTSIGTTIISIIDTDWQDPQSEKFRETFFMQSDPDIQKLVQTMIDFANYLQKKIEILQQYHSININF